MEAKITGEVVTAKVILRLADGSSILDAKEGITAKTIARYRVGKELVEETSKKLEGLGFKLLQTDPVSLTISGKKALFERVFQTTLETRRKKVMGTKQEGVEISFYSTKEPFNIPKDLSSRIADVVLPTPPELYP